MKIRIDLSENIEEDEIVIKCGKLSKEIQQIQQAISEITLQAQKFTFYKEEKEYYFPVEAILFFETSDGKVDAHTTDEVFKIKYCLYELEEILPNNFIRISKSTILNVNHIHSISRNFTSSSLIEFNKSYKQVYVSRNYYKELKNRLDERRNYEI